ncbi:hypothetical protein [Photobacterium leiognathi]|uniref:hypothetical protein n=1 Tax=Photobacterium leiognathi TaxID=553611 RepID=UPI00298112C2|nr:hypothetical protein [Photobacterium leiognathi]
MLKKLAYKKTRQFIDPSVMNSVPCNVYVQKDGCSLAFESGYGVDLTLCEPLREGTAVRLSFDKVEGFELCLASDYQAYVAEQTRVRDQKRKAEEEQRKVKEAERQQKNLVFNQALNLPFSWGVDIKVRMSGLSQHSWGDGRSRSTVHHVRVLEEIRDGRFKRDAGDFLCGKDDSKHQGYTEVLTIEEASVSCQACLRAAKRFTQ